MAQIKTDDIKTSANIKVIGIGGSGGNAVNHMVSSGIEGIDYIVMNTDAQHLHGSKAKKKINIGRNLTKGLGTGMNPDIGRQSAEETKAEIQESLKGADMIFIACGMGGGTGTGASPAVARMAKEQGILTIGVVTKPFFFEGNQRMQFAEQGIKDLEKEVDALIVIPNDRLLAVTEEETSFKDAFAMCDEILLQAVKSISELITTHGMINIDYADIKTILTDAGSAFMGIGIATGQNRAHEAALAAINSPLLDISIDGAKGVLFAITGGEDLKMHEVHAAAKIITESIDSSAKVIFGAIEDKDMKKGEIKVTVIATGFSSKVKRRDDSPMITTISSSSSRVDILVEKDPFESENVDYSFENRTTTITEKKSETITEELDIDESEDDWSAVPAFLRRKK